MRREIAGRLLGGALRFARPASGVAQRGSCAHGADRITTGAAMGFSTVVGPTSRAPVRWLPAGASAAMRTFQARPYAAAAAPPRPSNAPTPNAKLQDEFISGTSAAYLESLEDKFREDPNSVPASWAAFLRQMGAFREPEPISRQPHERIARDIRSPTPPAPPLARTPPSPHPQKSNIAGGASASLKRVKVKTRLTFGSPRPASLPLSTHQTPA